MIDYKVVTNKKNEEFNKEDVISNLKEWTKKNFYFNRNLVYYLIPENDKLSELPEYFNKLNLDMDYIRTKKNFDTPLTHMMSACFEVSNAIQLYNAEKELRKITVEPKKEE